MPDLSRVPLTALSEESKQLISTLLNPPKVIPSNNGLLRDWRGFAQICSISGEALPAVATDPDPFGRIISIVQKRTQDFSLESLKDALEKIERWDIVDDSQLYLEKDAQLYLERLAKSQISAELNNFAAEADILTLDDQFRIERGEEAQQYDAFILYADEDLPFVNEVVEVLEKNNNLKLCLKDRDLIAGISFEHEAIMRLISERCNRLITIISPDFLKSPANKFFLNFAQATGIDKKQERKIIPVVYQNCELPPQLTYFSKIYYKKLAPEYFWNKLTLSMKAVPNAAAMQKPMKESKATNKNEKINGFVQGITFEDIKKSVNMTDGSSVPSEMSKVVESEKSPEPSRSRQLFSWLKKSKPEDSSDTNKVKNSDKESVNQDSFPTLPSLDGLDSLSPITTSANTSKTKKKKKFIRKVQSLFA